MSDIATEKWEFSLLVDRANRILETRGLSELYLGVRASQLMGRHLVSFFDEAERLGFLRYMARLLVRGEAEPVSATLRSTSVGIKRFAMAARKGDGRSNWWILFSQELQAGVRSNLQNGETPFATAEEFAVLVDAHEPDRPPLDITVFRARALSEGTAPLTEAQQVALDEKLGESLAEHAYEHVVARPAAGEYAVLHGENNRPIEEIERQLVKVAAEHNLHDLELVRETRHLDGTVSTAQVIGEMRRKLQQPVALAPAPQPARRRLWIPAAAVVACVLVAGTWLLLRH